MLRCKQELITSAFAKYGGYLAMAEIQGKKLDDQGGLDDEKRIAMLELKITILNGWLALLNEDERFVIRKHVIDGLDWPRVAYEFAERWGHQFIRTERTLSQYQSNALRKIIAFSVEDDKLIDSLFSE